jgi:hypothetical protein
LERKRYLKKDFEFNNSTNPYFSDESANDYNYGISKVV